MFDWMKVSFSLLNDLVKKPEPMINKLRVNAHNSLTEAIKQSGYVETQEDVDFSNDMLLITDLMKTTIHGAIDKFSHSYSTLTTKLNLEVDQ
jgi:hypothetical protein